MSLVDEEQERYRQRMPDSARARYTDPVFAWRTAALDQMLSLANMVMEDEGVPEEVRRKVVRCCLYGSPDPSEAEMRAHEREQLQGMVGYRRLGGL